MGQAVTNMKLICKKCQLGFETKDKRRKYCVICKKTISQSEFLQQLEEKEYRFTKQLMNWKNI